MELAADARLKPGGNKFSTEDYPLADPKANKIDHRDEAPWRLRQSLRGWRRDRREASCSYARRHG